MWASETSRVSASVRAVMAARFAAYPVEKTNPAGEPVRAARRSSSSAWTGSVPVTSREALGVPGEVILPVPSLGVPTAGHDGLLTGTHLPPSPAEIEASGATNALDAIQRLRPAMLRGRGAVTLEPAAGGPVAIMLRVDDILVGTIDQATNIAALTVKEIRFMSPSDATTRFGTGYPMGAIVVTTKRK